MIHLLNWLDYILLGVTMCTLVLLALPPTSKAVTQHVHSATAAILGVAVYAFVRWQWAVGVVATTIADAPSCEDKVAYYRTLRNVFLDFSLFLGVLCAVWVASLKKQIHSHEA
mmetsp:Transcript_90225/g.255746  ORF Transcript_90225/g.255746 Transcript_90225/m.255746 type:complete len:113 (+) Transcript_90225:121-459(+)